MMNTLMKYNTCPAKIIVLDEKSAPVVARRSGENVSWQYLMCLDGYA